MGGPPTAGLPGGQAVSHPQQGLGWGPEVLSAPHLLSVSGGEKWGESQVSETRAAWCSAKADLRNLGHRLWVLRVLKKWTERPSAQECQP